MIVFDIGANNGASCFNLAEQGHTVYAFEPNYKLAKVIRNNTNHLPNYLVYELAISDYNGTATFNLDELWDSGCSSLYEFSDNLEQTWPGRTDFKKTGEFTVVVITLRDFVLEHKIESIDYLHCDVQGADLSVLRGLGNKISILKEGVIEVASNENVSLYKNTDNTLVNAEKFLKENNFEITKVTSNDIYSNELNIFFKCI